MKETLPSKLASKYARLGQTDEEQGSSTSKGKADKTSEAGRPASYASIASSSTLVCVDVALHSNHYATNLAESWLGLF